MLKIQGYRLHVQIGILPFLFAGLSCDIHRSEHKRLVLPRQIILIPKLNVVKAYLHGLSIVSILIFIIVLVPDLEIKGPGFFTIYD